MQLEKSDLLSIAQEAMDNNDWNQAYIYYQRAFDMEQSIEVEFLAMLCYLNSRTILLEAIQDEIYISNHDKKNYYMVEKDMGKLFEFFNKISEFEYQNSQIITSDSVSNILKLVSATVYGQLHTRFLIAPTTNDSDANFIVLKRSVNESSDYAFTCINEVEKVYNMNFKRTLNSADEHLIKGQMVECLCLIYEFLLRPVHNLNGDILTHPLAILNLWEKEAELMVIGNKWKQILKEYPENDKHLHFLIEEANRYSKKFNRVKQNKKSWVVYVVLAFVLPGCGSHNFYAGNYKRAFIQLGLFITIIGSIVSGLWGYKDALEAFDRKNIPNYNIKF